jgi:hypothetical protein
MPVNHLIAPCWVLDPPGGLTGEDTEHWRDDVAALLSLVAALDDADPDVVLKIIQLDYRCILVACAVCGDDMEDGDTESTLHLRGLPDLLAAASAEGWAVHDNGETHETYCPGHIPATVNPPREIPGQLTLDDIDTEGKP